MLITAKTRLPFLRPALALAASLCLLIVAQVAHSGFVSPVAPRVDSHMLYEGFSLKGDWRFQPGDNFNWADPNLDDNSWGTMPAPGRWPAGGYPEHNQIAWYRLTLQLDPELLNSQEISHLAVRLGKVLSAYELYAGGELVGGVGKFPPLSEITYDQKTVLDIPVSAVAEDGRLVLAMRVWGGDEIAVKAWGAGPSSGEFAMGEYRNVVMDGILGEIPGLLFCVLILAFGCYHMYLYVRNRSLDTYLWFGLTAINIALYGLMLTQWKYLLDISFLAMKKIEFGTIYLFPAIAIQMLCSLLQQPISRPLRAYQWSFVLLAVAVVAIPGHEVHYRTLYWEQLWLIPAVLYAPYLILREARAGNAEARTVALGTIVFLATCVNDLAIDLIHLDTVRLAPFGFIAILISMANRFTSMFSALEAEVAERTAELSQANQQLARAARVDHLTGLLNRRGFAGEAEGEVRRMARSGNEFSVVLADVDNFKQINDRHGHACGDHVLKQVGTILEERTRDIDRVARWGGEEFILLLPETSTDGAAVLAENLREVIAGHLFEFEGEQLSITMTFGIAVHRKGESMDACIARADTAMYHGKEQGRNKVMIGNYKGLTLVN